MLKNKCVLIFLAVMLIAGFTSLTAQEQGGEVVGTVFLPDGTSIPGVAVEATSPKLVGKRVAVTNETGRYRFPMLPSGKYTIEFKLEGFKSKVNKNVLVILGKTIKIDAIMETGDLKTEIVIVGNTPTIDVRKSSSAANITKDIISKLPKGRNFLSVITKGSGVNYEKNFDNDANGADKFDDGTRSNSGISFDGASSSENTFFVDGVDTTTLFTGDSGARVNVDFIEEVQVKSAGYAAEFGGSMGGVISVITKSGGNEFHGSLNLDYSGDKLDGGWGKTLRRNPFDDSIAEYVNYKEDQWNEFQPGFSLGGYIVKEKLWFFGAFQPRFTTRTRPASHIEGEGFSGDYTQKRTTLAGSLKLTGQIANNLRLSISGSLDNYKYEGDLPALNGSTNAEKEYDIYGFKYPAATIGGSLDYTLGNNLLISASGGFYRTNRVQAIAPDGPRYYHLLTNADVPGATDIVPGGWANYTYEDGNATLKDINTKLTGSMNFTYYADMLGGEHVLKAGVQYIRVGVDKSDAYPYDYYRFYWGEDYHGTQGTIPTTLGYVEVRDPFGSIAEVNSNRWAIYLQDSWTIGNRFTLNVGLRAEKEDIPAFAPGYDPPVQFAFGDKLAPRLGFAWDILGDSSLKAFGSFGIYYDVMKLSMAEGSYGGFKWLSSYYDLVNPDWQALTEQDHPVVDGFGGGDYFETRNWREVSFEETQPDMKPYQKNEFSFGLEKKMSEDLSISAKFLHNYIVNAIEDIGILFEDGNEHYFNGNPGSDWIRDIYNEKIAIGVLPAGVKPSDPVRKYTSFTVNIDKRFSNKWMGGISYTMSWLYGNFAGLASSDEIGRQDPGVERYYDSWFLTFTQDGEEELGYLMTDRRHQMKFYGAYSFDFGLTLGVNGFVMSGTPVQKEVYMNDMQGWYPEGRGSLGRTPMLWQLDVYAEQIVKLSDKYSLAISLNVTNITNNQIAQRLSGLYNLTSFRVEDIDILNGFNATDAANASGVTLDPRYKMETDFQSTIAARIGIKLMF